MSSQMGSIFKLNIFGGSHDNIMGVTIDNVPAGIKLSTKQIKEDLLKRKSNIELTSQRIEEDEFNIITGLYNGYTTGAQLAILLYNRNVDSSWYEENKSIPRASHADFAKYNKYNGFNDVRGGGNSSGRTTALLVIAGSVAKQILAVKNIKVSSHILQLYNEMDEEFDKTKLQDQIASIENSNISVINKSSEEKFSNLIKNIKQENDSIGGKIETIIYGDVKNIGEPYFDSVESIISHGIFSIPGVKALEFGKGTAFAEAKGSECLDEHIISDGEIHTITNNNGGIVGGIANGEHIVFKTTFKPTPSIKKPQKSIDLSKNKNVEFTINGRHDAAYIIKTPIIVSAVAAIAILDLLLIEGGKKWIMD